MTIVTTDAAPQRTMTPTPSTPSSSASDADDELLRHVRHALDRVHSLIECTAAAQWQGPTPCTKWTVEHLIGHIVEGVGSCGRIMRSESIVAAEPISSPVNAGARFEAAANATMRSLSRPDALERSYHPPWGASKGRTMANFLLIESVVHGWDLARATGQAPAFADDTVAFAHRLARESLATSPREPAFFGPEVMLDGSPSEIDRLAALLGRDPR